MKKTNSKYHLSSMEVGQKKYFPLALYDKIRMACYFTGKRWGKKFVTKKLEKTVCVTRKE